MSTSDYSPAEERRYSIGTLSYTKKSLWILFAWLLWNDLCLMVMENVAPILVPLMLKDHGATNTQIAFYSSTLVGLFTIWINPVTSTWSDRFRSRFGRRRPFLLAATPFCAAALAAIPFMPDLFAYLQTFPAVGGFLSRHASIGVVLFISVCYLIYQVFNNVILAIFTYYFWDVVPHEVLGRFSALTRIMSTMALFLWNYFLFGLTQNYLKHVFVGVAAFFFIAYMVSLWRVKEGNYPPPPEGKTSLGRTVLSYFTDCFRPYYLWFIIANAVFQIGNVTGAFKMLLLVNQYHMDRDTIGKMQAWPMLLILVVGYPMGSLVDRLGPARVLITAISLYSIINVAAVWFLTGPWSLFAFTALFQVITAAQAVAMGVFTVSFFPKEKLGQFCSANAMTYNLVAGLIGSACAGVFFDVVTDYRHAFTWSAVFYLISVPLYYKCYRNWKRRQAQLVATLKVPDENAARV